MPIYMGEAGLYKTEKIGEFEKIVEVSGHPEISGKYYIAGFLSELEPIEIHKYGVVLKNEYISKETFCSKLEKKAKEGSIIIFRLWDAKINDFVPFGTEDDLGFSCKITSKTE